ncbi:WD repeat-containing and planar cell polarity effector protein fritz homolog isoform X2 [Littorina saxatilis]|uniref:WD repeat-containing and planar cell polarity effector protein fritz homolog isoform X2 n=1 Tax=Littorina saxatilis TaxID=31220 RepID=UPI0038B543BF
MFIMIKVNKVSVHYLVGCHVYHDKGEQASAQEHPYHEERQQYTEGRDMIWSPRNKRPERLRDSIKEVEDLLAQYRCVQVRWRSRQLLQMVLSNGCIVSMMMCGHSGDVEKIFIDKSLVGKFTCETVCDAVLTDQYMVVCHADSPRVEYAHFTRRPPIMEAAKRLDKLSTWEPKVTQLDIPGPKGRRLERKFSTNIHQDMLLLWFSVASNEPWPWTPMSSEVERANLIVLSVNGPFIEVLTHTKTECDPVCAGFSGIQPHKMFTVEQSVGARGDVTARACILEIIRGKIQTAAVVTIPLKGTVECQARNPAEDKLLLGCSDASLVMYDQYKKVTLITRAAVLPSSLAWHPGGTIVFAASSRGDIQVFDMALTPLRVQFVTEDPEPEKFLKISRLFRTSMSLKSIDWCMFDPQSSEYVTDYMDAMFLTFDRGPPALLMLHLGAVSRDRFSPVELTREYIKTKQVDEAVCLLSSQNWDSDGATCYSCLSAIVNHLLRQPLNADREAQLEAALATFYAPKPPMSEVTIVEYRDPISRLARRFFHHLLRYARFDKAFLLAVDIGARDLFMDLHYMAQDKGETALAEVAKRKAEQADAESLDTLDLLDDRLALDNGFYGHHDNHTVGQQAEVEENIVDQLPLSRQHPWQQEYYSQGERSHSSATSHRGRGQGRGSSSGVTFHNSEYASIDDFAMGGDLISDYTAALMGPTTRQTHQHGAGPQEHEEEESGDGSSGNVKVIHFGIV